MKSCTLKFPRNCFFTDIYFRWSAGSEINDGFGLIKSTNKGMNSIYFVPSAVEVVAKGNNFSLYFLSLDVAYLHIWVSCTLLSNWNQGHALSPDHVEGSICWAGPEAKCISIWISNNCLTRPQLSPTHFHLSLPLPFPRSSYSISIPG